MLEFNRIGQTHFLLAESTCLSDSGNFSKEKKWLDSQPHIYMVLCINSWYLHFHMVNWINSWHPHFHMVLCINSYFRIIHMVLYALTFSNQKKTRLFTLCRLNKYQELLRPMSSCLPFFNHSIQIYINRSFPWKGISNQTWEPAFSKYLNIILQ